MRKILPARLDGIAVKVSPPDEYTKKGSADLKQRRADARYGDNPLADPTREELAEFQGDSDHRLIDRLHAMFKRGGDISDHELRQGIELTPDGLHKAAAALGVGPQEVTVLLASLSRRLRRDETVEAGTVEESYRRFVEADNHVSAEADLLGDMTVRSPNKARYFQGSQADRIAQRIKGVSPEKRQQILRPLVELGDDDDGTGFQDEIEQHGGSYNFPWRLGSRQGFGTVAYSTAGDDPRLRLISVRDMHGEDVTGDHAMRDAILDQARDYMKDA